MVRPIWYWFCDFKNIPFQCTTLDELESIRAMCGSGRSRYFDIFCCALLWSVWIERNYISFQNGECKSLRGVAARIDA